MADSNSIHYRIAASRPEAHVYEVTLRIERPDEAGQQLSLPAWIPGSYLVRDYARHIVSLRAESAGKRVAVSKIDKATWRCDHCDGPLDVHYEVYAWDESVRGAWLETRRGFFNGTCVFLAVSGSEAQPVTVDIDCPQVAGAEGWKLATTLPRAGAEPWGFGRFGASCYDELIDHPVEMGPIECVEFEVAGTPHWFVFSGQHNCDYERLCSDAARICSKHVELFGELPDMERYLFLTRATGASYGGLEHRASCALVTPRKDLPAGPGRRGEDYQRFLGLVSHEYFHLWNVKRIKPAAFTPLELEDESYTRLLWVFEGITSYYDDLALVRSGTIEVTDYLRLIGAIVSRVWGEAGHRVQSLADSSFDAWIKFYKPNENTPNAVVSYYAKGALTALLLDLTLRSRTSGRCSLDDVMRALWERYGKPARGLPEDGFEELCEHVAGISLRNFFERYVHNTVDLPLREALADVGIALEPEPAKADVPLTADAQAQGIALQPGTNRVQAVRAGSAAEQAGLCGQDRLLALDGLEICPGAWDKVAGGYAVGDKATLHVFRGDELVALAFRFAEPLPAKWLLKLDHEALEAAARRRSAWLHC